MEHATDDPILIVGAGPTGLVMASELARRGAPCRIIDKSPAPATVSRAAALQSRTLEIFDQMGVISETLAEGVAIHGKNWYAHGKRVAHLGYEELDTPYPMQLDLEQTETERILNEHLEHLGGKVERGTELIGLTQDARGVQATLRHADGGEETVLVPWLVGCDGAVSTVRDALGLPFEGTDYPAGWVQGDMKVEWGLPDDEMYTFLHPDGTMVVFPFKDGRHRLVLQTELHGPDGKWRQPTIEDFQTFMRGRGPVGATVSDATWMTAFRLHWREASHFREGRVFLAGDASHVHNPSAGQGMNTGMQDAHNLAWKLSLVQSGQAPVSILHSYEAERRPAAEIAGRLSHQTTRVTSFRNPIADELRDHLLASLAEEEIVQHRLMSRISELTVGYEQSPIVREHEHPMHRFHGGPKPGHRALDAGPLSTQGTEPVQLFDILRGTKHTLLLLAGPHDDPDTIRGLDDLAVAVSERYGSQVQAYVVTAGDVLPPDMRSGRTLLQDPNLSLHHRYGALGEALYLIRPDGYVGYRSRPAEEDRLFEYLGGIFQ